MGYYYARRRLYNTYFTWIKFQLPCHQSQITRYSYHMNETLSNITFELV